MGSLSPWHIAIVVIVALVIFGPKKLPELGRGVGSGIRDFRKGLSGDADEEPKQVVEAPTTPVVTTMTAQPVETPAPAAAAPAEPAAAPADTPAEQPADPAAPQS